MENLGTACIAAFRQYIRAAKPEGAGTTMVAEELGVISRKLSQEGVSYKKLLDEVRQKMAENYLLNSDLGVRAIRSQRLSQQERRPQIYSLS